MNAIEKLCHANELLTLQKGDVIRVPFLIKGELRIPPTVETDRILTAFAESEEESGKSAGEITNVLLGDARVLREPVIDRKTMQYTGEWLYQVLPVFDPEELIERDTDRLVEELYNLPFQEVLDYLDRITSSLASASEFLEGVQEILRRTAATPDVYFDLGLAGLAFMLSPDRAREMVTNELSNFGVEGSRFLDTWVKVTEDASPGVAQQLSPSEGRETSGDVEDPGLIQARAMPTRQLHITAGNAPVIPIVSTLRAISTKSAAVVKSPYGATIPGALVSLAACATAPDHPITRNLSIVYWPGGDESVEASFFAPSAFDRILIWGAPDAVASVRSRAMFTKLVTLNPRFGISWIGREAFEGDALQEVARRGAIDTMIWNQKACIASLVHYVEGDEDQIAAYARALQEELAAWDRIAPDLVSPAVQGRIRRMRRGKLIHAQWMTNRVGRDVSSAVVIVPGEFDLLDHPMSRMVAVRPVSSLEDVIPLLNQSVSTVGVFPESRRLELCDRILARGVSTVFPLGRCETMSGGMTHDGMKVLSELVDWKNR
jgi:hypothetical protein